MDTTISDLQKIVKFIESFATLSFEKNFFVVRDNAVMVQDILNSATLTGKSIVCCCKRGCIADANTLARKYRDDLFFFLYIVCYNRLVITEPDNIKAIKAMEENIFLWNCNNLSKLNIGEVLKAIAKIRSLSPSIKRYNLKDRFSSIGDRLNNFVHGNGKIFYNYYLWKGNRERFLKQLQDLVRDLKYITIVFVFLLILCSPDYVSSTDYVDCLEIGGVPPVDSQYWVAPFIEEFIKENIDMIDEDSYKYLKDNTYMQI